MKPTTKSVLNCIEKHRLVAILRLDDLSRAVELSRVLLDAGVKVQEFTLSNPDALSAVEQVLESIDEFKTGEATIGVGSVRNVSQVQRALDAGAQFVVTPVMLEAVIESCVEHGVPVFPGAFTPTEIAKAWDLGATAVKVFPARSLGPSFIKDVLAPMPELKLLPTGGINLENIPEYLAAGSYGIGVGGNLFDVSAVLAEDWEAVKQSAEAYVRRVDEWNND